MATEEILKLVDSSPVKVFWESAATIMTDETEKQLQRSAEFFADKGVVFFGKLWMCKYETLKAEFPKDPWNISEEWVDTIEDLGGRRFLRGCATASSGNIEVKNKKISSPHFCSPGKQVILLGQSLQQADRLDEIEQIFSELYLFVDTVEANPQIFMGKNLKAKSEEKITMTVLEVSIIKWGSVNYDMIFANIVALCLRNHKMRLGQRGRVQGPDRDFAITIKNKAGTIRNHPDSLTRKPEIRRADYNDNVKRLVEKGLQVDIIETDVSIFSEEYKKECELRIEAVRKEVLSQIMEVQQQFMETPPPAPKFGPIPKGTALPKNTGSIGSWLDRQDDAAASAPEVSTPHFAHTQVEIEIEKFLFEI
jgi:hypothetical protein